MSRTRMFLSGGIALALLSCGSGIVKKEVEVKQPETRSTVGKTLHLSTSVNVFAAGNETVLARRRNAFLWASAYRAPEPVAPTQREQPVSVNPSPSIPTGMTDALAPSSGCGGDLPPCYVAQRESGGSYSAYNPTGCGGSGCYGKWQFSGAWAGKLGLPSDLSQATPEQQDAAARELWAGGSGCSNWAAC